MELRRDLRDEGVVRKARIERNLYCGWDVMRIKGLRFRVGETAAR